MVWPDQRDPGRQRVRHGDHEGQEAPGERADQDVAADARIAQPALEQARPADHQLGHASPHVRLDGEIDHRHHHAEDDRARPGAEHVLRHRQEIGNPVGLDHPRRRAEDGERGRQPPRAPQVAAAEPEVAPDHHERGMRSRRNAKNTTLPEIRWLERATHELHAQRLRPRSVDLEEARRAMERRGRDGERDVGGPRCGTGPLHPAVVGNRRHPARLDRMEARRVEPRLLEQRGPVRLARCGGGVVLRRHAPQHAQRAVGGEDQVAHAGQLLRRIVI